MKIIRAGAFTLMSLTLSILLLAAPDARAMEGPGPWCVGTMELLGQENLSHADAAARLLAQQTLPERTETVPLRSVYVDAQAAGPGDGSEARPFGEIQTAVDDARPGDRIIVAPGDYQPVLVRTSGTAEHPIVIAGQADGAARPVIDGASHTFKLRGLIAVRGASHITVSGFRLQNAPRDGIFVEGTIDGERGIRILDNDIDTTGNSAIFVAGIVMRYITKVDEYRLFDVLVEGNRVTNTNVPDGVNEAISLGAGVDGFVIRNNYIFDTRQYGIDAKAGAINGVITDNVIHGIADHGIYIDAGSRTLAHIDIRRNAVLGARNGIVLARESLRDPEHPNLYDVEVTDNFVMDVEEYGIMVYRHKFDSAKGLFEDITLRGNCLCQIERDAVRLGGIGDFARNVRVESNLIMSSGGGVWNKIGAAEAENQLAAPTSVCAP
ncbi:nitrous oxide reductase family maturation protein NosD [uncultured Roseobacter sp.]|uniref:right-handed parallel beta-helix repeat-containing protein n=1 Tax=uncultured Roseobacter sp. TaxID=114847 RepID=UPI002631AB3F|nr:right-handed parallel beta-helix repeat-containing protein [uncultured Roseobacter sp.]